MQIPRIDPKNFTGLADKVVGLGKEIVGTLTGQDRLSHAGQVQQEKGTERIKAVRAEVKAQAHESKASAAGQAQKRAQRTKEAVNSWMGIGENIKGTVKEKAGDLTDDEKLQAEGNAQQTKGEEQTRESKERTEAKAHEKKADALEDEQERLEN